MNVLEDNWILTKNFKKTNISNALDMPILDLIGLEPAYDTSLIIFMLLKSYLKSVDKKDFVDFLQTPINEFKSNPKRVSIDQLVFNQPRINALKRNTDFFVKRGNIKCLCDSCAIRSLLVTSLFSGSCGQGYSSGLYNNKLIMFKSGYTMREIINNNKIEEKYSFKQLFSSPYKIKFIDNNKIYNECSICTNMANCYTEFFREPNKDYNYNDNLPLVIKTKKGKLFVSNKMLSDIQILSKINDGFIQLPSNIADLKIGECINAFSIIYDKAKLVDLIDFQIHYSSINVNKDIFFLSELIKEFKKINRDELEYDIARKFNIGISSTDYDVNKRAIEIFKSYLPDEISSLHPTTQQIIATALNKMRRKYEFKRK